MNARHPHAGICPRAQQRLPDRPGSPAPLPRAARRRATRARVLDSARTLFAERGFERTTVRAVAAAAQVDPALVMQRFGSKRELFTEAVQAGPAQPADAGTGTDAQLLTTLDMKLGAPLRAALIQAARVHRRGPDKT
ncbi:TetR family transcriptional regulator [Streptomyces sp. NPDC002763]|uniref:TetR family transcriptional regulator n=1 Tax=Streptomyces sp. NPDC002763 TaxID=3154427 RepID=UPI00331B4983